MSYERPGFLVYLTLAVVTTAGSGLIPALEAGSTLSMTLWALVVLVAGAAWLFLLDPYQRRQPSIVMLVMVGVATLSAVWSVDQSLTLERAASLAGTVIVAVYVASVVSMRGLVHALERFAGGATLVSILLLVFWDLGLGSYGAFQGIFGHKNQLGLVAAVGVAAALAGLIVSLGRRERLVHLVWMGICGGGLIVSGSRSPLLALVPVVVIIATVAVYPGSVRRIRFATMGSLVVSVLLVSALWLVSNEQRVPDDLLSGRAAIWSGSIEAISQRPVLGWGFGAFWSDHQAARELVNETRIDTFGPVNRVTSAHNGYLESLLDFGAVGLVFAFLVVVYALREASSRMRDSPAGGAIAVVLITFSAAYNLTESALIQPKSLVFVVILTVLSRLLGTAVADEQATVPKAAERQVTSL